MSSFYGTRIQGRRESKAFISNVTIFAKLSIPVHSSEFFLEAVVWRVCCFCLLVTCDPGQAETPALGGVSGHSAMMSVINCAPILQDADIDSAILAEMELFGWKEEDAAIRS